MIKRWFLFWLVGGLAVAGFWSWKPASQQEEAFGELSPAVVSPDGVLNVGAVALWQEYDANAVAADGKFRGKVLRVAGRVTGIEKLLSGSVVLELASGNPIFRPLATLNESQHLVAATLARGQQVVVRCVGGEVMMRMPQLEGCTVLEVVPVKSS